MSIFATLKQVIGRLFTSELPRGIQLQAACVPLVAHNAFSRDLRYRVGNQRIAGANQRASLMTPNTEQADESPAPPSPPAGPSKPPGTVIAFPTRSDKPDQPPIPPDKAPGEIIAFPTRTQYSSPDYVMMDKVLEQLLARHAKNVGEDS
ncbi:MAG: hypothetical protein HYX72_05985 [Acidobacteria bacterium]|nr:hypothetical protein [Acidobacteriota bacterium]